MNSRHPISSPRRRVTCVLLLALGLWLLICPPAMAEAVVKQLSGKVEVGRGEPPAWQPLSPGDQLAPQDRIRTGADGRVEIAMDAGTMRVHENSMLRLPAPSGEADRVELERGHSLFDVLRRKGRRFEVHTPTVVVSVKGTRFGVDARGELGAVAVYRGLVGVREAGLEQAIETLVREGFVASGGPGLPIELDVAPQGDPWAGWQDFRREVMEQQQQAPARAGEIDRARQTLHRATSAAVVERAAERRPEVAERLEKMRARRARRGSPGEGSSDERPSEPGARPARPVPAAPLPTDPSADPRSSMMKRMMEGDAEQTREAMMQARRQQAEQMLEQMKNQQLEDDDVMKMSGLTGDPDGSGPQIDMEDIYQLDPAIRMDVVDVLQDLQSYFESAQGSLTLQDVETTISSELVARGYDQRTADDIVDDLLD